MLRSKVAFRIRQKHNRQGTSTISHRECFEQEVDSVLAQWVEKESSHETRNGQLCSRSYTTYLGKAERKHQNWLDPNDQELQTLMSRRNKAHQRVLQTRSTSSTTAAYKDACRLLQKRTRALKL